MRGRFALYRANMNRLLGPLLLPGYSVVRKRCCGDYLDTTGGKLADSLEKAA